MTGLNHTSVPSLSQLFSPTSHIVFRYCSYRAKLITYHIRILETVIDLRERNISTFIRSCIFPSSHSSTHLCFFSPFFPGIRAPSITPAKKQNEEEEKNKTLYGELSEERAEKYLATSLQGKADDQDLLTHPAASLRKLGREPKDSLYAAKHRWTVCLSVRPYVLLDCASSPKLKITAYTRNERLSE